MTTAPNSRTLPELLAEQAEALGDHPAVVSPLGNRSYRDLQHRAERVRRALGALGVGEGDTVGLLAPNVPEWIDAAFGALWAGARVAAFNTWVKAWDLEYLLSHSETNVLMMVGKVKNNDLVKELQELVPPVGEGPAGEWHSERFPALRHVVMLGGEAPAGATSWDTFVAGGEADRTARVDADPEGTAFILYTSGSTEYPKAVPLVHRGLVENGFGIGERLGLTREDRVWFSSPLFWSFGAANALMATLTHGATLVLQETFDAKTAADLIAQHRCTVAYMLPAIADALVREAGEQIRQVGSLRSGTMIGRPDELRRVVEELGVDELCNIYGATETYGNCCVTPHGAPLEKRLTTQGPPLPGVELRIVDPSTRGRRAVGEIGEIEVRGYVTAGYLGDEAATARVMTADGWYRTGDLGSVDEDGYVSFVGRATEMIKSSGINISPAEIERFLTAHPEVEEVVVVAAPHPVKDEVPVAFVCLRAGSELSGSDLLAYCKASIAGYKVPAAVVVCDEIPRTGTGKVSRMSLRAEAAAAVAESPGRARA